MVHIKDILMVREPFLMIDRIEELEPGKRIVASKYIGRDLEVFKGHYPQKPIYPGVLLLEGAGQSACAVINSMEEYKNQLLYTCNYKKVKFEGIVRPDTYVRYEAEMAFCDQDMFLINTSVKAENKLILSAQITLCIASGGNNHVR